MLQVIRSSRVTKIIIIIFLLHFTIDFTLVSKLLATNPPSRPEMGGPSAVTYDDFVDLFTGDFHYGIPLFEMGDIPLSLNYNAGVTMDEEASWVGLGWSLNPGSITRTVRGIPDDFKEDIVTNELNIKDNTTYGASVSGEIELFGLKDKSDCEGGICLELGVNVFHNSYTGWGIETSLSPTISLGILGSIGLTLSGETGSFGDLGYSYKLDLGSILGLSDKMKGIVPHSIGITGTSREGLKGLTLASKTYGTSVGGLPANLFADQTYTPRIQPSFLNTSQTFKGSLGGVPIFGADVMIGITGYGSEQILTEADKDKSSTAYGYLYLDEPVSGNYLMDFNRETDDPIKENSPYLPSANMTYDMFSINSPGLSGTFRAYRNDVGFIRETPGYVIGNSTSKSFEFSVGAGTDPGINIADAQVFSWSGTWGDYNEETDNIEPYSKLGFTSEPIPNEIDEQVYFAMTDELGHSPDNDFINTEIGGSEAVEFFNVKNGGAPSTLINELRDENGSVNSSNDYFNNGRKSRTTNISYYTVNDVEIHPTIGDEANIISKRHQIYLGASGHHIGKIIVTATDGTRYVYGLPVYNKIQKEVTFSVGQNIMGGPIPLTNTNKDLVHYQEYQAQTGNTSGKDNYYSATTTPAYAYSFLLTEIFSPDYVDLTNNGTSDDDYGTYVQYNYGNPDDDDNDGIPDFSDPDGDTEEDGEKYYPNIENYKWRTPSVEEDFNGDEILDKKWAAYSEGLKSDYSDDMANYIYGEKEIWFLYSIETKKYKAKFYLSDRTDALGVEDENGGLTTADKLKKIDKIELYSKAEESIFIYNDETVETEDDIELYPVKTVYFEYDYGLCEGVPNKIADAELSGTGKLKLKKVYFTYNNSNKAKYNAYKFEYTSNYDYNAQAYNRWGDYMPNSEPITHPNKEFPYVDQSDPNNDAYAAAWCLNTIYTPAGGKIVIEYESDDYSYIQDKHVTQMYPVIGMSNEYNGTITNRLYENYDDTPDDGIQQNYYVIFELPSEIPDESHDDGYSQSDADFILRTKCLNEINAEDVYFRFLVNSDDDTGGAEDYDEMEESLNELEEKPEYVSGYSKYDIGDSHYCGAIKEGAETYYTKGYLKLKPKVVKVTEGVDDEIEINPVTKSAWQFCMENTRYNILNEDPLPATMTFMEIIDKLTDASFFDAISSIYNKPNDILLDDGFGKIIDPDKSVLRLGSISGQKQGGGHRVKKIEIFDNWDEMTTGESAFSYGKEYTYLNLNGTSSSGVASYEPLYGGDEISLRQPKYFDHSDLDYQYGLYHEIPLCESLYPAPSVGYSRVEVKNLTYENVKRTATGKSVYQYYTAYDFPVIVSKTTIDPDIFKPDPTTSIFKISYTSKYTGSQGYCVEVNDMHGKLKSVEIFAETNKGIEPKLISRQEYKYFKDPEDSKKLKNFVNSINPDGTVINDFEIGVNYDMTVDFRKQITTSLGYNLAAGVDIGAIGPLPGFAFNFFANLDKGYESAELSVVTKVVSRNGILKEVITTQDGSTVTQQNLYFDSKTGVPVITSTKNEFEDIYYSLNYPAYWSYEGMGLAYENDGFTFKSTTGAGELVDSEGKIISEDLKGKLVPGDEISGLAVFNAGGLAETFYTYFDSWVYEVPDGADIGYYLINRDGSHTELSGGGAEVVAIYGTVSRSGRRNFAGASVGTILCKTLPLNATMDAIEVDASNQIISANAITFSDIWQKLCDDGGYNTTNCNCMPDITTEGEQLIGMLNALISANLFLEDVDLYDETPSPAYFYNFTSLLYEKIGADYPLVQWLPSDDLFTIVDDDLMLNLKIGAPQVLCDLQINFGDAIEEEIIEIFQNAEDYDFNITVPIPDYPTESCSEVHEFTIEITGGPETIIGTCSDLDCIALRYCVEESNYIESCTGGPGDPANPYVVGVLGKWKPKANYMFKTDRLYTYAEDTDPDLFAGEYTDIKIDGAFATFDPFWEFEDYKLVSTEDEWQKMSQSLLANPFTSESESINALDIYSSGDYGYNNSLPILVASNAAYQQVGFENFEDEPQFMILDKECNPEHFDFSGAASFKYAHTGNYSKEIPVTEGLNSISYTYPLTAHEPERTTFVKDFLISEEDCLPSFSPFEEEEKTYLVTVWIKEETDEYPSSYDDLEFNVEIPGYTVDLTESKGTIVDDWQRIEYTFTIPDDATGELTLSFTNEAENSIYIDDIRVQPADALLNCYVFDFRTHKVMAELDENHYATFYEYDAEGQLVRVKKETERGVMTIQEGRYYTKKQE